LILFFGLKTMGFSDFDEWWRLRQFLLEILSRS